VWKSNLRFFRERGPEPGGRAGRNATVHRLGIGAVLRRKLATTNPIESCLSTVQRVARNVKRWREGNQPLRWTPTGLLEAEKKFRRIKGYQELLLLKERLNPSRIPQKEVRTLEVA
jgi:putative transposase